MSEESGFIIRLDAKTVTYFCGTLPEGEFGFIGTTIVLSSIVFDAMQFETREEANEAIDDLSPWPIEPTVSEIQIGQSRNLS